MALDTFQSMTSRDFRQRYQGSYGWYTDKATQKRTFVLMTDVQEMIVNFIDENENKYQVVADTGVMFDFVPVQKKLFVYKKELMYIRRRPQRQWARGINLQNTRLCSVLKPGGDVALSFPRMVASMQPHGDVKDNITKLANNEINVASLTNQFGVVDGKLYLYDNLVGEFAHDLQQIRVLEPMFKQEIVDLMMKNSVPYGVV